MDHRNEANCGKYKCSQCTKQFSRKDTLHRHELDSHGSYADRRRLRCDECKKQFSTYHNLLRHQISHTEEPIYQCAICGKGFKRSDNLKRHERIHQNIEIECDDPNWTQVFPSYEALKRHTESHTDEDYVPVVDDIPPPKERLIGCAPCPSSSYQIVVLDFKNNVRGHQCTQCLKVFKKCNKFYWHYKLDHKGKTGHRKIGVRCNACPRLFNSKQDCNRHQLLHQSDPSKITVTFGPICDKNRILTPHQQRFWTSFRPCTYPHQIVSVNEKHSHQCTICLYITGTDDPCYQGRRHYQENHNAHDLPVERAYQCCQCWVLFRTMDELTKHSLAVCQPVHKSSSTATTSYATAI